MRFHLYQLYGVVLKSEVLLPGVPSVPDRKLEKETVFLRVRRFPLRAPLNKGWVSFNHLSYYLTPDDRLAFVHSSRAGDFRINCARKNIDWNPSGKGSLQLMRLIVCGRILGLLMPHLKPSLILHASIPVVHGRAIGFVGGGGQGKSTLVAHFLNQGFPLLSDDMGVVQSTGNRFVVQPGFPEIRLWPSSAQRLNPGGVSHELLCPEARKRRFPLDKTPGSFFKKPVPLRALYFLERRKGGQVHIETLKPHQALLELCRNNYSQATRAPHILRQGFDIASRLVQHVSVKRLTYPSGFKHLPAICRMILQDLGVE